MNLWNKPGIPHRGWVFVSITDIREEGAEFTECMMCNNRIRWIHWMKHDDYPDTLGVGCVCAGKMASDYERAQHIEREFINKVNRRQRWLAKEWEMSSAGHPYINIKEDNITLFKKPSGKWIYSINRTYRRKQFNTIDEVKSAALTELFWQ